MRRGRGRARRVRLERHVAVAVDPAVVPPVAVAGGRVRRPGAVSRRPVRAVGAVGVARGGPAVRGDAVDGGQAAVAGRAARDAVRRVHGDEGRRDRLYPREGVPEIETERRCSKGWAPFSSPFMEATKNQAPIQKLRC